MVQHAIRRTTRRLIPLSILLCTLSVLLIDGFAFAAVGDQVELNATHRAGIPFHNALGGTKDFQRIPDGTRATVIDMAQEGRWLKLSLPDGRTGWVTSRYIRSLAVSTPSTGTLSTTTKSQRIEEGTVTRVADGDTLTVITPNQTKLRIRMWGIDAPETPKGTTFPGQPSGLEAEAYLKQLVEGKRVKVEIYQVDRYKRLLSTIFLDGKTSTWR
jgi:hypothetical protein